jgi:hypothetical protein
MSRTQTIAAVRGASRTAVLGASLTAALVVGAVPRAVADVAFAQERTLYTAMGQNSLRTWVVKDKQTGDQRTLRQFASRWFGTIKTGPNAELVLYTSGGFAQDHASDVDVAEIRGISDVKLKGFYHVASDQLLLSAGVNLPTGITKLSDEQVRAASAVAPNVYGFRQKRYGEGFDLDLGVSAGKHLSPDWTLGGGVSFLHKGAYDLDLSTRYDPGSEIAFTVGADFAGGRATAATDLVYRLFTSDQTNGQKSFDEGGQLELNVRSSVRGERFGLDVSARDVVKSSNTILAPLPAGTDDRVDNGNNFWLWVTPSYQPSEVVALKGLFEYTATGQGQQQPSSGWATGFGGGIDLQLRPSAILEARAERLVGGSQAKNVDLSGWDVLLGLRVQH